MSSITAQNINISFPVRSSGYFSLKTSILKKAIGGKISGHHSTLQINALEDVSFNLKDGDRVGLIGHNGAGKSTLLRTLAGVYSPASGSLNIEGAVTSLLDISMGMDPEATGIENIRMRGVMMGLSLDQISMLENEISEFSELGEYLHMPVRTYSSGMHLRLAFATSTAIQPEILLLDEWLSVGDQAFKEKAEKRMVDIVGSTKILVIASHSAELINNICNRFFLISGGTVCEVSAKDLLKIGFAPPGS